MQAVRLFDLQSKRALAIVGIQNGNMP